MPIIRPTRRKLLTGVAGLTAARVLGDLAEAQPVRGGSAAPVAGPPVPAIAQAYGMTNLLFQDEFTSLSTIDLADTRANGFKWYIHNAWPNATQVDWHGFVPTPAACFTQYDSTTVQFGGPIPTVPVNNGNFIATACADPTDPSQARGFSVQGPFYAEVRLGFDQPKTSGAAPAFWLWSTEYATHTSGVRQVEDDIFEHQSVHPWEYTQSNLPAIHEWPWPISDNQNFFQESGVSNPADQNIYGGLHVTPAMNGGTGIIATYVNNSVISGAVQNYSPGGPPSPSMTQNNRKGALNEFASQHSFFMFGWNDTGVMRVDWVRIWGL